MPYPEDDFDDDYDYDFDDDDDFEDDSYLEDDDDGSYLEDGSYVDNGDDEFADDGWKGPDLHGPAANHSKAPQASVDDGIGTLMLYGGIGWGRNRLERIAEDLEPMRYCSEVHVRVNSSWGDVFSAIGIHQLIADLQVETIAYIEGVATTAAAVICAAADRSVIAQNAHFMIDRSEIGQIYGNALEMQKCIEMLDYADQIATLLFAMRAGTTEDAIGRLAGRWLTASEAALNGFVNDIGPSLKVKADVAPPYLTMNLAANLMHVFNAAVPAQPDRCPRCGGTDFVIVPATYANAGRHVCTSCHSLYGCRRNWSPPGVGSPDLNRIAARTFVPPKLAAKSPRNEGSF